MQDFKPMLGYYGFLIALFGLGLLIKYGFIYIKKKREKKNKELFTK